MKKTIAAAVLVLLVGILATGCQSGTGSASPDAAATKNSDAYYATWTKSDWENASDEQKELAVIFLVEEAVASQGADEEVVQSTIDQAEETLTADQYEAIEDAISEYYDKAGDEATLEGSLNDVMGTISKYVPVG